MKEVSIPEAGRSKHPQSRAEGLGCWDSFAIHNLWANRPTTKSDFVLWKGAFHKWSADVTAWMRAAGCTFLDVKEFAELGKVEGGLYDSDPELNHQLAMLDTKRNRLTSLIERFRAVPLPKTVSPILGFAVSSGTAAKDGHLYESADITLTNVGDPFTLVARAKLLAVTPGYSGVGIEWHYEPRHVNGGNAKSSFCIATIGAPVKHSDGSQNWLVIVRQERMERTTRWEGSGELQFDVQWQFYADIDSVNRFLGSVTTRVALSDDHQRLHVSKLNGSA